jgi:hypothetical protein
MRVGRSKDEVRRFAAAVATQTDLEISVRRAEAAKKDATPTHVGLALGRSTDRPRTLEAETTQSELSR